jgi:hypothetical protein
MWLFALECAYFIFLTIFAFYLLKNNRSDD